MPPNHRPVILTKLRTFVLFAVLLVFLLVLGSFQNAKPARSSFHSDMAAAVAYSHKATRIAIAAADSLRSIRDLHAAIASSQTSTRNMPMALLFEKMFGVTRRSAVTVIPPEFLKSAKSLFAAYPSSDPTDVSFLENQTIFVTHNKYTAEESMFNEVRRYRPGYAEKTSPENEAKLTEMNLANAGRDTCDFCSEVRTATDSFGRIDSKHCYAASNVAKYAQWHGLIIPRSHNPMAFDSAAVQDYIATALAWFAKAHALDPMARFPHLMWDATRKASASQVHQHLQLVLAHDRYLSRTEQMRRAARDFTFDHGGRNYWEHFVQVHAALGLAAEVGTATILSHVCPIKEREIIVVGENAADPAFGTAIAVALDAMKAMGMRAFSAAVVFPELDDSGTAAPRWLPSIARIVDRGSPLDTRSDVGAQEFYGSNNVGADPFSIMPELRKRVAEL